MIEAAIGIVVIVIDLWFICLLRAAAKPLPEPSDDYLFAHPFSWRIVESGNQLVSVSLELDDENVQGQ